MTANTTGRKISTAQCARVAAQEARVQPGVQKLRRDSWGWIFPYKSPGVSITIDDYGRLHADLAIIAILGFDLPDLGRRVQNAVFAGIQRITELPIGEINVTIAAVKEDKSGMDWLLLTNEEENTP